MQIHIWNAFASNNSGSYTIVGSFPSEALAAQVAAELSPVLDAQTSWLEENAPPPSPLSELVKKAGIDWESNPQRDEWPQYGGTNTPEVVAVGHQVLLHHDYTVTLPEVFGHYFYRRGGSVDTRLNHTHGPLIALFEVWWHWDKISKQKREYESVAIVEAIENKESAFYAHLQKEHAPAWQAASDHFEVPLTIGAVFSDLVAGCEAVRLLLASYSCEYRLKILEPLPGQADLLHFLR